VFVYLNQVALTWDQLNEMGKLGCSLNVSWLSTILTTRHDPKIFSRPSILALIRQLRNDECFRRLGVHDLCPVSTLDYLFDVSTIYFVDLPSFACGRLVVSETQE